MKCMIPEISWHNREPVLSADFQPIENDYYKLATGGSDCHLLIWQVSILSSGAVAVDIMADLTRHQRAVNAVRWSPNGQYLASADDDANIIIWNLKTDNVPLLEGETNDKETWIVTKILRGHKEDIYDLCWSPNSLKLLSGSIDNTAIIWDFTKGKLETILSDHKAFVQGVAWDPRGQFVATLSSDRMCRVFESATKHIKARIGKGILPVPKTHALWNKEVKYFHDDTFKSYFRRVQFSPDGNLLITPCGSVETDDSEKALNATFLFTLDCLAQPAAVLPLTKQCSIAVRCCPILFELRPDGPDPAINLPYRMIIAVATDSDVILYDTQQLVPIAHFQKIHYTRLTDLAWSIDGRLLLASSTDGFCTFITFETNELGIEYIKEESEPEESALNISGCEELGKDDLDKKENVLEDKPKKSNFLMKWANQAQKSDEPARKRLKIDLQSNKEEKSAETVNLKLSVKTKNHGHERICEKLGSKNKSVETEHKSKKINLLAKWANETEDKTDKSTEMIDLTSPMKVINDQDVKINKIIPKRIIPTKVTEKQIISNSKPTTPIAVKKKAKNRDVNNHKSNVKCSPLLNFLRTGSTPEKPKSKFVSNKSHGENQDPPVITILDESEARDAWKCDDNRQKQDEKIDTKTKNTCLNESSDLTDTIPPDFKLQLEESTLESHDNKIIDLDIDEETGTSTELKTEIDSLQKEIDEVKDLTQSHTNQEELKVNSDKHTDQVAEKENSKLTSESEMSLELRGDDSVRCISKKTGKRIPLITLSSPKTKKQKHDT